MMTIRTSYIKINTLPFKFLNIKRLMFSHYLTLYLAYDQISNNHKIILPLKQRSIY